MSDAPAPIERLVDQALRLFEAVLPRVLLLAVGGGVAINLVSQRVIGAHQPEMSALVLDQGIVELLSRYGWTLLALALPMLWLNAAVMHTVGRFARDGDADAGASAAAALRFLPHVVIATALYLVAMWLGMLALLVPGIWLAVALSFFQQSVLFDGQDGVRALSMSFRLTRGRWWRTFGYYLMVFVAMLIGIVLSGLAGRLIGYIAGMAIDPAQAQQLEQAVLAALGAVMGIAVDALLVVYYLDLTGEAPRRAAPERGALIV